MLLMQQLWEISNGAPIKLRPLYYCCRPQLTTQPDVIDHQRNQEKEARGSKPGGQVLLLNIFWALEHDSLSTAERSDKKMSRYKT